MRACGSPIQGSLYRHMATEHMPLPAQGSRWVTAERSPVAPGVSAPTSDWAAPGTLAPARVPVDEDVIEIAADLAPGKALELGCGGGQNSIWLAQRGWIVTAVDSAPAAIAEARSAAAEAGVTVVFDVVDISAWRPASRYDVVISTFALPARGMGRGRMLDMAAAAVAPGGSILLTDLDVSLGKEGWMGARYLVSTEELERHLDGFRIHRSRTRLARHRHGYEERILPVANVIATRRTDLRSLF